MMAEHTDLRGVVTQPDRPSGRGHKRRATPVKLAALELGIPVHEPSSLATFASTVGDGYDVFALASYGKILPQALLELPRLGALNVHPSLLPRYRGATPLQSALRDGANETGVTIMLMDAGMDTGDIVLQERTPIDPDETYGDLHDRLAHFGALVLRHAIDLAQSGFIPREPQRGEPSVTRPIVKGDLEIDWRWDAARIINTVRAFSPRPAARATVARTPLKVLRAEIGTGSSGCEPGEIVGVTPPSVTVQCGRGAVNLVEVIAPNKPAATGAAFASHIALNDPKG
jgi:methionyl-tRNA formyltransferase